MPAVLVGASQSNEKMWQALKIYIMRERQRKKQEQEADEEEERLRKKWEHQQKQDVMTFGETQEQIINLENEITKLQNEKHDLFTELKRVLYEEGNKKRQFVKENSMCSEVLTVRGYSPINTKVTYPELLSSTTQSTSPLYESSIAESQMLTAGFSKKAFTSPSIPPVPYHNTCFKPLSCIPSYSAPSPFKHRETSKSSCYPQECFTKESLFQRIIERSLSLNKTGYSYSPIMPQQSRETPELSNANYPTEGRASLTTHQSAYVTNIHSMEQHTSAYDEAKRLQNSQSNRSIVHSILSDNSTQQSSQVAKADGITTGFPVRTSSVIPHQSSSAITYDDTSDITLSRLLRKQSLEAGMPYNVY